MSDTEQYKNVNRIISIIYFLKGINYSYKSKDGYLYNIDKNDTYNVIACIDKAMDFDSSDLYFKEHIDNARNSLKMCFDLKRIWILLITSLFYILNVPFIKVLVIIMLFVIFISSFKMVCVLERFKITNDGSKIDNFCDRINKVFFTYDISSKFRNLNKKLKHVNGSYYGKMVITISEIGEVELFDNQSFKYRKFYNLVNDLKNGISPLKNIEEQKGTFLSKLFKYKLF